MYVAIEGSSRGKDHLARLLQPAFQAELLLEVSRRTPSCQTSMPTVSAMRSRRRSSFCSAATTSSAGGAGNLGARRRAAVGLYFEKDALFAGINLRGDELEMYHRVHEALAEKILRRT